jgi:hypothetical protein
MARLGVAWADAQTLNLAVLWEAHQDARPLAAQLAPEDRALPAWQRGALWPPQVAPELRRGRPV